MNFGPGRIPQANPADAQRGGIGTDSLGTQFRDWGVYPILARLTAHGSTAAYQFEQVYLSDSTGTYSALAGGVTSGGTTGTLAFEVNANAAVTAGTTGVIVELWPNYGTPGYWSFVAPGTVSTTCKTVATSVTCVSGELVVTYDLVRVVNQVCS